MTPLVDVCYRNMVIAWYDSLWYVQFTASVDVYTCLRSPPSSLSRSLSMTDIEEEPRSDDDASYNSSDDADMMVVPGSLGDLLGLRGSSPSPPPLPPPPPTYLSGDGSLMDIALTALWDECVADGMFRYDLAACATKRVPGPLGLVAQLNEGRATKKRQTEFSVDQVGVCRRLTGERGPMQPGLHYPSITLKRTRLLVLGSLGGWEQATGYGLMERTAQISALMLPPLMFRFPGVPAF